MVPEDGLEPSRYLYRWILSPLRLPISPLGHLLVYHTQFNFKNQCIHHQLHTFDIMIL
jgi:hypothetical protein